MSKLDTAPFEYGETGELGVALTQGQVCPVICLLLSLLIFLFIQQNGYHLSCFLYKRVEATQILLFVLLS